MNSNTPLFGRISIGANRVSLGRGTLAAMLIRAAEQIKKARHKDDLLIRIELSPAKLPDSTTFDKSALLEQQLAEQTITDLSADSPFQGITIGRVTEAMLSPEYNAYAEICEPEKRIGLSDSQIRDIRQRWEAAYPDCASHFPVWLS